MTPIEPPIADEPAACSDVRRALTTLSITTQAVGALMAELDVSADVARNRLDARSRQAGVSVDEVARQLLAPYTDDQSGGTSTPA